MINLLPPQYKKELKQEESWRMVFVLGILFLLSLFCLVLILLSLKIYIEGQSEEQKILFQREERQKAPEGRDFEENIKTANQNLLKLNSFYQNQIRMTPLIEQIAEILPPDVYLNDLSFSPPPSIEKEYKFLVSLTGFSGSREALFKFKENLQAQENFASISVPLASWVKPTDINFNLNFKIK